MAVRFRRLAFMEAQQKLQFTDKRPPAHERQFLAFHHANPQVYARLRDMALALRRRGFKRWGVKNLYEKLRYDLAIETFGEPEFRLNNNYHSHYARLLMESEPQLAEFFELRGT